MRMSARFVAKELIGYTTAAVYEIWKDMGLVIKDKWGDWVLTDYGRSVGGRMSKGTRLSVPTFDVDQVIDMMIEFYKKTHGEK